MRIVLTGASGSLGAYLVKELVNRGHDVIAWSGSRVGERFGVPLVPVDLEDGAAIGPRLDRDDPAAVIHAAAMSAAENVRLDPERGRRTNVLATQCLADWCGRHGRRLVYTSTDSSSTGRVPGTERMTPPSRSSPTAARSGTPSLRSGRSPADWWRG